MDNDDGDDDDLLGIWLLLLPPIPFSTKSVNEHPSVMP